MVIAEAGCANKKASASAKQQPVNRSRDLFDRFIIFASL
jgi:hypothetical protein